MGQDLVNAVVKRARAVISRRAGLVVGLWGEPGIGKTHVATRVLAGLPCTTLSLPAAASARSLAAALPRGEALPAWAATTLAQAERGVHVEARSLADAVGAALAASAPIVLHLEDLHEADAERTGMVAQLARSVSRIRGAGLLVTSRSEPPAPIEGVKLEALDSAGISVLLDEEAGPGLPAEAPEWIWQRTRGNPLFALEFLRYLRRQGYLWLDGGRWRWKQPPRDFVPASVDALIAGFIQQAVAEPGDRWAMEVRVLLPSGAPESQLRLLWASACEGVDLEEIRLRLEREGVLRGLHFAHPLFGEVIARDLDGARRRDIARHIAAAALPLDAEVAAALVEAAAFPPEESVTILRSAAARAEARGDAHRAGHWLAIAAEQSAGEAGADLALEASRLLRQHDIKRATSLATLAHGLRDDLKTTLSLADMLVVQGESARARQMMEARPEGERSTREWWEGMIHVLARSGEQRGDALDVWRHRPDFHAVASPNAVRDVANVLAALQQPDAAREMLLPLLARGDLTGRQRGDVLHDLALAAYHRSDFAAVEAYLLAALKEDRREMRPFSVAEVLRKLASLYLRVGRHGEAVEPLREAGHLAAEGGHARIYAIVLGTRGTLEMHRGDFAGAETTFLERVETMERVGDAYYRYDAHGDLALLYLEWRPPHGAQLALRHARSAVHWARAAQRDVGPALALLARAEKEAGHAGQALATAREAVEAAAGAAPEAQAMAKLALGIAADAAGAPGEGRAALQEAVRVFEDIGMTFMAQRAGLELDRMSGDAVQAERRRAWFAERGLGGGVAIADRYFPSRGGQQPAEPRVLLRVLGPVTLEKGGNAIPYRGRKRSEILAYLLEVRLAGRGGASLLELADAVYPGVPEPEARATIKQQVYLVRSSLGSDSILSTGNGYALGALATDAEDFLRGGDSSLWRGAYLDGLGEGWHAGVRDALVLGLTARAESLIERDPAEAARLAVLLCQMEPYSLPALGLAVTALRAGGDERLAAHVYTEARVRLLEVGEHLPEFVADFPAPTPTIPSRHSAPVPR